MFLEQIVEYLVTSRDFSLKISTIRISGICFFKIFAQNGDAEFLLRSYKDQLHGDLETGV